MMSLTRERLDIKTHIGQRKRRVGDGSVSIIHIAREKIIPNPTEKKSTLHRDDGKGCRARDGAVESALSSVKNASSVVKAILDYTINL